MVQFIKYQAETGRILATRLEIPDRLVDSYPLADGEVLLPHDGIPPSSDTFFVRDGALVERPPEPAPVSADMVKAEAERRIVAIMPEYEQRNALALGLETMQLYGPDPAAWPPELQAINAEMQAKWTETKAIRAASNAIEAMTPIPADFAADHYWSAP